MHRRKGSLSRNERARTNFFVGLSAAPGDVRNQTNRSANRVVGGEASDYTPQSVWLRVLELRRDVAQPGSAPEWGSGGRGFKSRRPDSSKSKHRWHLR
jgi:hypothetical protein